MTPQALPNLFADVQWKQLTDEERHEFGRAFVDQSRVGSSDSSELAEILDMEENKREVIGARSEKQHQFLTNTADVVVFGGGCAS